MSAVLSTLFEYDWKTIVLTIMVFTGVTVTQWFFIYGTTYAITTLGYSQGVGMSVTLVIGVAGMSFSLLGGLLADRYGLKPVSLIARVAITILLYPAMKYVLAVNDPVDLRRDGDHHDAESVSRPGSHGGHVDFLRRGRGAVRGYRPDRLHLDHRGHRRQVVLDLLHRRDERRQHHRNPDPASADGSGA
jgi:hypothetical protein